MHARKRPCPECPWRRDTPPGQFPAHRYEALRATAPTKGPYGREEAGLSDPMFACHKSAEGQEIACAGWLAVCGVDHLRVRVAVAMRELPACALRPGEDWPALFETYDEMAAAQGAEEDS